MKIFRLALAGAILGFAAASMQPVLAAGGESEDAAAVPSSTLELTYELSMSIFGLGHVNVSSRIQDGAYQAQSTLVTNSFISIFWQAHIDAWAKGQLGRGNLRPARYDADSRHRDKRQQVTVVYGPQGPVSVQAVPPYPPKYPVAEEQQRNTVDPLSAMLLVATGATANTQNPCGTAAPVYDGRRRYDIQFSYVRTANVRLEDRAYVGPALVCEIKYVQIAGFKQKIIAEGKRLPPMFAWLVSMPSRSDPSRRYLVPVRLWAETSWGTAAAEVSRIQLDGQNLTPAN